VIYARHGRYRDGCMGKKCEEKLLRGCGIWGVFGGSGDSDFAMLMASDLRTESTYFRIFGTP